MFKSTGLTWNDFPMSGSAVAMTVPSRFSMKKAVATRIEIAVVFLKGWAIVLCSPRDFQCRSLQSQVGDGGTRPCRGTPYFALATSGSGMASVGNFMG